MTQSRAREILDRADADPKFRDKLIHLGSLIDQFTYPSVEAWMQMAPYMVEFAGDAGLLGDAPDLSQESLNDLLDWLLENIDELAYHARGRQKLSPGRRYQQPAGKVFLSWTVKLPRDRHAAMGIMKALDYFNIMYYDYAQHQLDDSLDLSEQIIQKLNEAIGSANISLEICSSEIGSRWVQWERNRIQQSNVALRIFACLESEIASCMTQGPSEERRVLRVDMSGGRSSVVRMAAADEWMAAAADTRFYQSDDFLSQCFAMAWYIRKKLIRSNLDRSRASWWLATLFDLMTFRLFRETGDFLQQARELERGPSSHGERTA